MRTMSGLSVLCRRDRIFAGLRFADDLEVTRRAHDVAQHGQEREIVVDREHARAATPPVVNRSLLGISSSKDRPLLGGRATLHACERERC